MAKEKFVPIEIRENEKEIKKISERAQTLLLEQFGIDVTNSEGIPTIAYAFFSSAMAFVNERKAPGTDYSVNLMQLFEIGINHRVTEDGEKEGNYVPFLVPGQEFKLMVKDDSETEQE
jgi:hypothetical protein